VRVLTMLAAAGLLAIAGGAQAQGGVFDKLAGPGEKVSFKTDKHPNGDRASVRMSMADSGDVGELVAEGALTLDSPKIFLQSLYLRFAGDANTLTAKEDVRIRQENMNATCGEMIYDLGTGDVTLKGNPDVTQTSGNSKNHFSGMDEFTVATADGGGTAVRMAGEKEVRMVVTPVTAAPANGAGSGAKSGLSGFGDNIDLKVSPREGVSPKVNSTLDGAGEIRYFRASGSVRLKSDTVDLRCDELSIDGPARQMEALYNVYLKKDGIEADCGRMVYDLDTGRVVLTVDPDVRQRTATNIVHIWDIDTFVMEPRPNGGYDISYDNPDGPSSTEIISLPPAPSGGGGNEAPNAPVEINPDNPPALPR